MSHPDWFQLQCTCGNLLRFHAEQNGQIVVCPTCLLEVRAWAHLSDPVPDGMAADLESHIAEYQLVSAGVEKANRRYDGATHLALVFAVGAVALFGIAVSVPEHGAIGTRMSSVFTMVGGCAATAAMLLAITAFKSRAKWLDLYEQAETDWYQLRRDGVDIDRLHHPDVYRERRQQERAENGGRWFFFWFSGG